MTQANDLGPLPTAHPRQQQMDHARAEYEHFLLYWGQYLTSAEIFTILSQKLFDLSSRLVAVERRKDGEK